MDPIMDVNIASPEFKANPYPSYARLRAEAPVYWQCRGGAVRWRRALVLRGLESLPVVWAKPWMMAQSETQQAVLTALSRRVDPFATAPQRAPSRSYQINYFVLCYSSKEAP